MTIFDPLYKCNHFGLHELVPPDIYHQRGERGWSFLNLNMLILADKIRDTYGPTFINTYALPPSIQKIYGVRKESGLRVPHQKTYTRDSDHSRANAWDMIFQDIDSSEIRKDIIEGKIVFDIPVVIECTIHGNEIGWLHIATGNYLDRVTQLHL